MLGDSVWRLGTKNNVKPCKNWLVRSITTKSKGRGKVSARGGDGWWGGRDLSFVPMRKLGFPGGACRLRQRKGGTKGKKKQKKKKRKKKKKKKKKAINNRGFFGDRG